MHGSVVLTDARALEESLLSFLYQTKDCAAAAVLPPLALWDVLRSVAQSCVVLLRAESGRQAKEGQELSGLVPAAMSSLVAETSERLLTVELILEKMHSESSTRITRVDALCASLAADVAAMRQQTECVSTSLSDSFEKLQRGIVKHADDVSMRIQHLRVNLNGQVRDIGQELKELKLLARPIEAAASTPRRTLPHPLPKVGVATREWRGEGVEVVDVIVGMSAHTVGIERGDIIIGVGHLGVRSMKDFSAALAESATLSTVALHIFRSGNRVMIECPLYN